MLHQLHAPVLQVDEADAHAAQELQVLGVVGHEVLSPQGQAAHTRLSTGPEQETDPGGEKRGERQSRAEETHSF